MGSWSAPRSRTLKSPLLFCVQKQRCRHPPNPWLCTQQDIFEAAVKGSLTDLVIYPLPLTLLEVHKRLAKRRFMKPSDIHSPFLQASTSPLALWITDEDDPKIPPYIDLGHPSTFWWKDVEGTPGRVRTQTEMNQALGKHVIFPAQARLDATSPSHCPVASSI
jgi:hypothetical protein